MTAITTARGSIAGESAFGGPLIGSNPLRHAPQAYHQGKLAGNFVCGPTTPTAHDGFAVFGAAFVDTTGSQAADNNDSSAADTSYQLLTCGSDNKAKRWDLRMLNWDCSIAEQYLGHTAPLRNLSVSPDGKYALTNCEDGGSRVFRIADMEYRRKKVGQIKQKRAAVVGEKGDKGKENVGLNELDDDYEAKMRLSKKYDTQIQGLVKEIKANRRNGRREF
jgi:hypothetical protein